MPLWPNFVGPAYRARSQSIAPDTCVNLYVETTQIAQEAKRATLYGTPGMLKTTGDDLPTANCRGLFAQDGRMFGVNGDKFFEYLPALGTVVHTNTVANDGSPVTFASNGIGGNQLAVCTANTLYIYDLAANTLSAAIVLPGTFVPVMVGFMDGYFLLNEKDTPKVWFSNLYNGLVWSATDFFTRSSTSDNIVGFLVVDKRVWCFGSKTTEIFQDSGDATTPFIPYPGTVVNEGAISYRGMVVIGDAVVWMASSQEQGNHRIAMAQSLQVQIISTPALSFELSRYPIVNDVETLSYTQEGHQFVCFTFPNAGIAPDGSAATWCYDLTEQCWHQRQAAVVGQPTRVARWPARGCCAFGFDIFVGHYNAVYLCKLDLNTFTDQQSDPGTTSAVPRERVAPYVADENQWIFVDTLELGIQSGVGNSAAPSPTITLETSADSGQTFNAALSASPGASGDTLAACLWMQLGRFRSDRLVIRIRQTDPVRAVWGPGLFIRAHPGSGQL